jgi:hypothetical protein
LRAAKILIRQNLSEKVAMHRVHDSLKAMKKLDDSWNGQDLQTFRKYHAKNCIERWPNQPPTHGIDGHEQEAIAFFKMFPDQHLINNPYKNHAGPKRVDLHVAWNN